MFLKLSNTSHCYTPVSQCFGNYTLRWYCMCVCAKHNIRDKKWNILCLMWSIYKAMPSAMQPDVCWLRECQSILLQGDTKKNGHHQKSNNFQNFVDTKVSSLYYKNSLFHWRSKNVFQISSLALQAHLDLAGKVLDDPPAFLPWNCSYCCCDSCLQVRDSLGVVAIHLVLKVSPQITIWGVQVQWMQRPLQVTPAADQPVRETLL